MEEPEKLRSKGIRTRLSIQFLVLLLHTVHCQETIYSDIIDHPRKCNFTKLMCNESRLLEEDKIIILNIANEMRNRVAEGSFSYLNLRHDPVSNMNKLSWNQELEKKAASIVSSCPETSPSFISEETSILPGLDGIDYIKITKSSNPSTYKQNGEMPGCEVSTITYTEKLTLCAPQKIKERLIGYLIEGGLSAEARKYDLRDFWIVTRYGEPRLTYRRHESTDIGCSYLIRAGKTNYFSYLTCIHCAYNGTLPIIGHPGDECTENYQHFDEKYENLCSDLKNEYESIKKDQHFVTCKAANDSTTITKYKEAETNEEVSDVGKSTTSLFKNSTCIIEFSNLTRIIPVANDSSTIAKHKETETNGKVSDSSKSTFDLAFKNSTCTIEFSNLTRIMPITTSLSSNKTTQYSTPTTLQSITKSTDTTSLSNGIDFKKSSEFGSKTLSTLISSPVKLITKIRPSSTTCRKTTIVSSTNQLNSTFTMIPLTTKTQTLANKTKGVVAETISQMKSSPIIYSTTCRKTTRIKSVEKLNTMTTPMVTITTRVLGTSTVAQENHTTPLRTSTSTTLKSTLRTTLLTSTAELQNDQTPTMILTSTTPKLTTIRTTTSRADAELERDITTPMTRSSTIPKSTTRTTSANDVESKSATIPIISTTITQTTCRKTIQTKNKEEIKMSKTTPMRKITTPLANIVKPQNHISPMTSSIVTSLTRTSPFTTYVELQSDTLSSKARTKVTPTTCRKTTRVISTEQFNKTISTPITRTMSPFTTFAEPQNHTIMFSTTTTTTTTPITTSNEPQSGITLPTSALTTHAASTMHRKSTCRKTTKTSTITVSIPEMKIILPTNSTVEAVTSTGFYPLVNDTTSTLWNTTSIMPQIGDVPSNSTFIAPKITSTHSTTKNITSTTFTIPKITSTHFVTQNISSTSSAINWRNTKISKLTLPALETTLSTNSTVEAVTSNQTYSDVDNITSSLWDTSSILQSGHKSSGITSIDPKTIITHPTTRNVSLTPRKITTPSPITIKSRKIINSYESTSPTSNSPSTYPTITCKKTTKISTISLPVSETTPSTNFTVESNKALRPITHKSADNITSTLWNTTSILLMEHTSSDTTPIAPKIRFPHPTTETISSTPSKITLLPITITSHKTAKSYKPTPTLKSSSTYSSTEKRDTNKTSRITLTQITTLPPIKTKLNVTTPTTLETTTKQITPTIATSTIFAITFKCITKDDILTSNISLVQKSKITTPTITSIPTPTKSNTTIPMPSTTPAELRTITQPTTSTSKITVRASLSSTAIQPKIPSTYNTTTPTTSKTITKTATITSPSTTTQPATPLMINTTTTTNTTTPTTFIPTILPTFTTKIISITPKPKLASKLPTIVKYETASVVLSITESNTTLCSPKMSCKNVTSIVTTTTPIAKKSTDTTIQNITSETTTSFTNIGTTSQFPIKNIKLATNCQKKSSTMKRTSRILNTTIPFITTAVSNISETTYINTMAPEKTIDSKNITTNTTTSIPIGIKISTTRLFINTSITFVIPTKTESAIKNTTSWTTASSEKIPKSTTILSSTINAMKSQDKNQKMVTSSSIASDKTSIQPVNTTLYNITSPSTDYMATKDIRNITSKVAESNVTILHIASPSTDYVTIKDIRNITSKVTESNVTILQLITMSEASKKTTSSSDLFEVNENVQGTSVSLHNQTKSTSNTITTKILPSSYSSTYQSTTIAILPESKSSTLMTIPLTTTSTKVHPANFTHQMTNTFSSTKFKSSSASVTQEVSTGKPTTTTPQTTHKSTLEVTHSSLSTTAYPKYTSTTASSKIITSTHLCDPCKTTSNEKKMTSETTTGGVSHITTNISVSTKSNNRQRPCICINWVVIGLIFTVAFVFAWCLLCWQRVLLL